MKISSASKKVICSALSAAMVVAFAPTLALGADINNGELAGVKVSAGYDDKGAYSETAGVVIAVDGSTIYVAKPATTPVRAGYDLASWQFDGDGVATDTLPAVEITEFEQNIALSSAAATAYNNASKIDNTNAVLYPIWTPNIANGTEITLTFDPNGGVATPSGIEAEVIAVNEMALSIAGKKSATETGRYAKDGAAFDFWFYDADGDGTYDAKKGDVKVENNSLDLASFPANVKAITLKASYKIAAATSLSIDEFAQKVGAVFAANDSYTLELDATNLKLGAYKAVATVNGAQYFSAPFSVTGADYTTVNEVQIKIPKAAIAAGDIKVAFVKNDDGSAVASAESKLTVYSVTFSAGDYGTIQNAAAGTSIASVTYLVAGKDLDEVAALAPATSGTTGDVIVAGTNHTLADSAWAQANGSAMVSGGSIIDKDYTFVAQYTDPAVKTLSFGQAGTDAKGNPIYKLTYQTAYVSTDAADVKEYKISIAKDGAELTSLTSEKTNVNDERTLAFGSTYDTGTTVKAAAAAGDYTVTVTEVLNKGVTRNAKSVSKTITVESIEFDLNGGEAESTFKPVTLVQSGAKLNTVLASKTAYSGDIKNSDKTLSFKGWSADGTTVVDPAKVTVNGPVALTAIWEVAKVAAPAIASATLADNGKTYTLVFSCATEGATMTYSYYDGTNTLTGTVPETGLVGIDPSKSVTVTANPAAGSTLSSATATFVGYKTATTGPVAVFDAFANSALSAATADSQSAKPVYYSSVESVVAAKTAGEGAFKATAFATGTAWGKAVTAQEKAVVEAVVAYGKAQIASATALTKRADGKYEYSTAAQVAAASAALDQVVTDFVYNNDNDAETVAKVTATNTGVAYAAAATTAVTGIDKVTVEAADAEPAIAVTDQLKAAATADAAEAALAAYAALTDDQKALVASADVAAAQAIVDKAAEEAKKAEEEKAAQALTDAQDEGTLNKIKATKSKTYTLKSKTKTTSAHSISYTTGLSKSGNAVTYAKVSGSSKITVTSAGKVKLKKGAVKGKTYTATVLAACGTQTRTVKVKFVIK